MIKQPARPPRLAISLLLLRLGIAIVMGFWTADKMLNPDHAEAVFSNFYGLEGFGAQAFLLIGMGQALIVTAFTVGLFKTFSYAAVLLMHAVSTFSSWRQYADPFENLLFFAAWPMLTACIALFLLRQYDAFTLDNIISAGRRDEE